MPEETRRKEPNEEVKKRAVRRVGGAIALALIASIAITVLTHRKPPATPVAEPEPTVLPAEPPASAVQSTVTEPPIVSAVDETPPAQDAPPTVAPPPPLVVNVPQATVEIPSKPVKPVAPKLLREVESPAKPAPVSAPPVAEKAAKVEKSSKPHATLELVPVPIKEITAKTGEMKKPVEARAEPVKPVPSAAPPSPAESTAKPRASLELVPAAPVKEIAPKDGETKKPVEVRAEPTKPAASAPPPPAPASQPIAAAKGYAVQLGVFSNPTNAVQMQEKLTQHSIQSYTETKLNIGPFQNKTEADQTMAKVRGLGIGAVVVPLH